jgi:acyl-CoA thioesterase
MPAALFEQDGDWFVPSELTRGPWDPDAQHAGPPAGLIGRAVEAHEADPERPTQVGRITFEVLRPVPIKPLQVSVETLRPGRSIELLGATLSDAEGEVVRANAWRLRTTEVDLPKDLERPEPLPGPEQGEDKDFFPTGQDVGYHTAMEYRFVRGSFLEPGHATVWMRMRHPLLPGEEPSPLVRVLVAADSGNGVSATLDWTRFLFINVDLTVHLHRLPAGEWVCLDAITLPESNGVGMADTALYDEQGSIGRATQTLLVGKR